jgi:thiamine-phosphate pyrophosphorylase
MFDSIKVNKIGRLCIITDTELQDRFSHEELAMRALKGGADVIQFRDKKMPTDEMIETAVKIKSLCAKFDAQLIINDRVDVALVSDADGVHLGAGDIPIAHARKLLGRKKIIGATAHSIEEAIQAENKGADYVGFGHIFPTESKFRSGKPKGLKELSIVCEKLRIPVLAIGGISAESAQSVIEAGAYGIAVIGSVARSKNPIAAAKMLKKLCGFES